MTIACLVRQRSRDRGSALLIAVLVTSVCLSLTLVGVHLAVSSSRSSGVDRQRVLAVNAAEAGVDSAYTAIQAAGVNLPCALASGDVHAAPDTASYTTAVTYFDASGAKLNTCPPVGPVQALIRSTATTNTLGGSGSKPTRVMEALVNLTAQSTIGLNKAIFADGPLTQSVAVQVVGNSGANADIYSNGDIVCGVAMNVRGSVESQGAISTGTSCNVAGNLWAGGSVTSGVSSVVAGFVKAGTGTISQSVASVVTGNLYAGSTISYAGCLIGKCFPNNSPGPPPRLAFPVIRSDAATMAAWTASAPGPGYTLYDDNACGGLESRIVNVYAKKGTPTLLRTTCPISFSVGSAIVLSNDLAIFAKGGINAGVSSSLKSNSATRRDVHWIVPYDAATATCSSPSISTGVAFSVDPTVWMFVYSPCNLDFNVAGGINGQVYGGSTVTSSVALTLNFQTVPTYGVDPTSLPATGYNTSVVYKRESR